MFFWVRFELFNLMIKITSIKTGEFDPGSEQTLAACLTHASRTRKSASADEYSGARVSNAWVICPPVRNNPPKGGLIPDNTDALRSVFQRRPLFTSFRRRMSPRTIS